MKRILIISLIAMLLVLCLGVTAAAEEVETIPEAEEPSTASSAIADFFVENIGSILAGGSVAASLFIAWLFKKGLLPAVSAYVTKVSAGIGELRDNAEKYETAISDKVEAFFDKATPVLESAEKNAQLFGEAMSTIEQAKNEREAMTIAVRELTSITLAMIESSRLPESVKEKARIGAINAEKAIASITGAMETAKSSAEGENSTEG